MFSFSYSDCWSTNIASYPKANLLGLTQIQFNKCFWLPIRFEQMYRKQLDLIYSLFPGFDACIKSKKCLNVKAP